MVLPLEIPIFFYRLAKKPIYMPSLASSKNFHIFFHCKLLKLIAFDSDLHSKILI